MHALRFLAFKKKLKGKKNKKNSYTSLKHSQDRLTYKLCIILY